MERKPPETILQLKAVYIMLPFFVLSTNQQAPRTVLGDCLLFIYE